MAEAYTGPDFSAQNENATEKAEQTEKSQEDAGKKGAEKAIASKSKNQPAAGGAQAGPAGGGGMMTAMKNLGQKAPAGGNVGGAPGAASGGVVSAIKGSFKDGGKVPETGNYEMHAGEEVVPASRASDYRKVFSSRAAAGKHSWGGK